MELRTYEIRRLNNIVNYLELRNHEQGKYHLFNDNIKVFMCLTFLRLFKRFYHSKQLTF